VPRVRDGKGEKLLARTVRRRRGHADRRPRRWRRERASFGPVGAKVIGDIAEACSAQSTMKINGVRAMVYIIDRHFYL
jgi:hypothetical protein